MAIRETSSEPRPRSAGGGVGEGVPGHPYTLALRYPQGMRFTKMQALGNDFIALNGFVLPPHDWRALAMALCDRHFGIGADGLFVALPSESADARMLFFNPDGTEDRCGNGLRCFGKFLYDEGLHGCCEMHVETYGGAVDLRIWHEAGKVWAVCVSLGEPVFEPEGIPTTLPAGGLMDVPVTVAGREWRLNVVSTGTPHAVILVDELPDEETFQAVSPLIENHPLFPARTSVMWTHFESAHRAEVRIWERATGETLGCGTGAAAVAVVGKLRGLCPGEVTVASRGGEVLAAWKGEGPVTLTGPAHTVYAGEIMNAE